MPQNLDPFYEMYHIDLNIASCTCQIHSYHKDCPAPVICTHYVHRHLAPTQWSYTKDNNHCTLFFFLSGQCSFIFENAMYTPTYGSVLLMREHEPYTVCLSADTNMDYFEIDFPVEFFSSLRPDNPFYGLFYRRNFGEQNMITLSSTDSAAMLRKLEEIEHLVHTQNEYSDFLAYSHLIQIMGLLHFPATNPNTLPPHKIPEKLKMAVDYMHTHFLTIASIEEVSDTCGITGTYLARMFKKHLGCVPNEYLASLRVSHACYLLKGGASLTEACFQSGFNSYPYFITKFKLVTGQTPASFQRKL